MSVTFFFIHGVAQRLTIGETAQVVLENLVVTRAFGVGAPGDVGRDDHAVSFPERVPLGQRFGIRDIEAGSRDMAAFECVSEDHRVVDFAARYTDEKSALLHLSKLAGLKDIPAFVRQANDHELLELALLENLQREDLNAMEIALSYKRMMDELNHTQEQVAERMGKDRSTVTNYIRLLRLPPDIQIAVRNGEISMGHARALINVDTIDKQLYIFDEIKAKGLSVRQTENLVRNIYKEKEERKNVEALPPAYKKVEDKLASHFGTKVKLRHSKDGSGAVTFEYFSLEEMNKLLDLMNVTID